MPFYVQRGRIPHKRHTQFRKEDGSLYREEVMGTRGFSGIQSILYHLHPPTALRASERLQVEEIELASDLSLEPSHVKTVGHSTSGDPIASREWLLVNRDVKMGIATPTEEMDHFYRNAVCDEVLFVHSGKGMFHSQFGTLSFGYGDYLVIPVGTTYQLVCDEPCRFLTIESRGRVEVPRRYRNEYGQLLEHCPYCERDFRLPEASDPVDIQGEFEVHVKHGELTSKLTLAHHPFDVVGWDGYLYPWIFNIKDFEPITGSVHQPPPVHQTFVSEGYVICSFVPRMFDYHPEAIPAPYNHSNVNSDEVLYYVDGDFMSRKGIDSGSFTLHPAGIPHGPHPGTAEASIGQKRTEELAVMLDTFSPLQLTAQAAALCDSEYVRSWLEN